MSAVLAPSTSGGNLKLGAYAAPGLIIAILAMMILPLPPILLDLLFTFNIALSLIVLLVSLSTIRPLDISAFPTILLVTTLMRLSLNVASTRVVLLNGHTGPDAAGKVIEAFGHFLLGGNFAVGLVVFAILVVINFVVVTKGAGRIAEVGARFTLDAMPGKQMAIDADLNAGLIGEAEARKRRAEIAQEADFYGSMDGASKFVRGDAIAGILILFVNVVGGLAIGLLQHKLSLAQATENYVLLAIGDGLVAQIPALVISIAAGMIVSRVGSETDMGTQLVTQLASAPRALVVTGVILLALGFIPGMPHFAFILFGGLTAYGGWWLGRRDDRARVASTAPAGAAAVAAPVQGEATWEDVVPVDVLSLEVGYRLIPLVDRNQDGELLKRIKAIRRKFAQDIGFLPPTVHIRDNLELAPGAYRLSLKGVPVGEGELITGSFLAINPGRAVGRLTGTATKDPAFGLPATWVDAPERERAQASGYTVVDAPTVAATHFSHVLHANAAALLGRTELTALLEQFAKHVPKLADDLVPKLIPLATLQKVLANLLEDGIAIRDLRTILESLADHASRTQSPEELTAAVRVALGRAIVNGLAGGPGELPVIALDAELERLLSQTGAGGESLGLEPSLADLLLREATQATAREETLGHAPVLLVPDRLRSALARLLKRAAPGLKVLGHGEIPDTRTVRVSSVIGERR
ncbi:flagellar biosynthesis protein FlhA [Betaproteobacteria bacterium GR16-43]|nr:flagellar biosynthesis protein FlhA [Betaproteobacteria bacterium GR16-43]